ncbi:hypothetical protein DDE83_006288 [Stemphylium lycopersici]|uniref:Uncharacterized protein n=1 Tax=Stemphylium lycopersici TaxID=183478 RepID=A0A364MZ96_STELY|nr:hypothetical protein DDE83_006288 [Stemphylium lycopersici]
MARKYGRRRDSGTLTSRRRLDPGTSRSLEVLQEAEQFHESPQTPALFWKEEFGPHPFLEPKEQFVEAISQSWRPKSRSENIFEEDIQEQLRNSYLIALSQKLKMMNEKVCEINFGRITPIETIAPTLAQGPNSTSRGPRQTIDQSKQGNEIF